MSYKALVHFAGLPGPDNKFGQNFDHETFLSFWKFPDEYEFLVRHEQAPTVHTITEYDEELDKEITETIEEIPLIQDKAEWEYKYDDQILERYEELRDYCEQVGLFSPTYFQFVDYVYSVSY